MIYGKLTQIKRRLNSRSGNPRFSLRIDNKWFDTAADIADAQAIDTHMLDELVVFTLDEEKMIDSIRVHSKTARYIEAVNEQQLAPRLRFTEPPSRQTSRWLHRKFMHYDEETGWLIGTNPSKSGAYPMLRPHASKLIWCLEEDADPESKHAHHQALARYLGRKKQS